MGNGMGNGMGMGSGDRREREMDWSWCSAFSWARSGLVQRCLVYAWVEEFDWLSVYLRIWRGCY